MRSQEFKEDLGAITLGRLFFVFNIQLIDIFQT